MDERILVCPGCGSDCFETKRHSAKFASTYMCCNNMCHLKSVIIADAVAKSMGRSHPGKIARKAYNTPVDPLVQQVLNIQSEMLACG